MQDKVNQEDGEQNEVDRMKKGADSTGNCDAYVKERLVICNEEDSLEMVELGFNN